jgi:copper chaperone CopZ
MARVRFCFPALQLHFPSMVIEYRFNAVPFFQFQSMHIDYDPQKVTLAKIEEVLDDTGYTVAN